MSRRWHAWRRAQRSRLLFRVAFVPSTRLVAGGRAHSARQVGHGFFIERA